MIFVYDKSILDSLLINEDGYSMVEKPENFIVDETGMFKPRSEMETNEEYKQLIPYIVLINPEKGIFCYQRSKMSGETRLHGKWSLGIGGHINETDKVGVYDDIISNGINRELIEEVGFDLESISEGVCTFCIYDKNNSVGRVHLGLCLFALVYEDINSKDYSISHGQWLTFEEILQKFNNKEFETWSEIVVKHIIKNLHKLL